MGKFSTVFYGWRTYVFILTIGSSGKPVASFGIITGTEEDQRPDEHSKHRCWKAKFCVNDNIIHFNFYESMVGNAQEWRKFQLCRANCVRMYKLQINYLNRLNCALFGKQRGEFNTHSFERFVLSLLYTLVSFLGFKCNSDVRLFLA